MKRKLDPAHAATNKELAALEKRIAAEYQKAADELQEKIDKFFADLERKNKIELKKVEKGIITQFQYEQWYKNQLSIEERFEALRNRIAERMTEANIVAAAYINDTTPGIYSLNRNYAAYTIEQQVGANVGFDLWDERAVKRLIVEQPDLMPYYPPKRAVNRGIDLAYGKRQITRQVTSGILQGESIKHLADRLQTNIPDMNRNSAIRAARTAVTGAQNAGRQDSYDAAVKMGIELEKRWVATLDGRTRHNHARADGQVVPEDKPFDVGGYELMYPGDPGGPGHEIYNCRCTVIAQVKGVDMSGAKRRARDPETGQNVTVEDTTYSEWVEWKKNTKQDANDTKSDIIREKEEQFSFSPASSIEEAKRFATQTFNLDNADYDNFDLNVANMVNREISRVYNIFGDLHEKGALRAVMTYPKKSNFYAAYQPGYGVVYMKNVKSKNSLAKMLKDAKEQYEIGFWSTGEAEHAVRHELGHAVQHLYTDKNAVMRNKISVLREQIASECGVTDWSVYDSKETMLQAGETLSYYGLRNDGEFIAESIAEYMGGAPREIARKVVDILLGRE